MKRKVSFVSTLDYFSIGECGADQNHTYCAHHTKYAHVGNQNRQQQQQQQKKSNYRKVWQLENVYESFVAAAIVAAGDDVEAVSASRQ